MKTTSINIRTDDNGRPITLTTMDIKVLLLRAELTITQLAGQLDCTREALSKTINGSLIFPQVRKKLTVKLEKIAAEVAQQKTERLKAS